MLTNKKELTDMNVDNNIKKQQIIADAKEANRVFKKAWSEGYDDAEIDLELLDRLICYARELAMKQ